MSKGIFVSYRRDDAAHATGRIADALAARFGKDRVFVDVDSVALGEDFVRKIDATIENSDTFLAVIGPNWLSAKTPSGERRIDTSSDFIRMEVLAALKSNLQIIPVLVDGASMPRTEDLPPDLAQLVRHNAIQVEHNNFTRDMTRLLAQLSPPKWIERLLSPRVLAGIAAIAALAALLVTLLVPNPTPAIQAVTTTIVLADQGNSGSTMPPDILAVTQVAERDREDKLTIRSKLPYFERLRDDAKISGIRQSSAEFQGGLPILTVQVTNPTNRSINVTELNFEIQSTKPDLTTIPVLRENLGAPHTISLSNQGWGEMVNTRLTVKGFGWPLESPGDFMFAWRGSVSHEPCRKSALDIEFDEPKSVVVGDVDGEKMVDISALIPDQLRPDLATFCVLGDLIYEDARGEDHRTEFRTRVASPRREPRAYAALSRSSPFKVYDLKLDYARDGYVEVVPAAREIAPNETAIFILEVQSERSASFEVTHRIRLADDRVIEGRPFSLELIYPRTRSNVFRLRSERRLSIAPAVLGQFDPEGRIETFEYDPNGREGAWVLISNDDFIEDCAAYAEAVIKPALSAASAKSEIYNIRRANGSAAC